MADNVKKDCGQFECFFRIFLDSDQMVKPMISQLKDITKKFGFKKVAIIEEDAAWVEMMVRGVRKAFGERVVVYERPHTKAIDYSSEFSEAKAAEAQSIIFTIFSRKQIIPFVTQCHDMKVPAVIPEKPIQTRGEKFCEQV